MGLNLMISVFCIGVALSLRPWRMLSQTALWTPWMAVTLILPWFWAAPKLLAAPITLQWSGACLVTLLLGWPLAVFALVVIGAITAWIAPISIQDSLQMIVWAGLVPATLSMLLGAAIRRWLAPHLFIYIFGRAFFGTVLCTFVSLTLAHALGNETRHVTLGLSMIGDFLMAWGDAIMTGMLIAIFVAYRPQWLATWSDRLYLPNS